jgi:hypothetical protein
MVEVDVPCFGHLLFTEIPISAKGRVAMSRDVMGKRSVFTTRIAGGFEPGNRLRLSLQATGGGCDTRSLVYRGHRS